MSGFSVQQDALNAFAETCDGAAGKLRGLDPSAAFAAAGAVVPETDTAEAATKLGIELVVSCQAAGDDAAALAASARDSAATYGQADDGASRRFGPSGGAR